MFNRTGDREVIVAFDWEGAPGRHKLVAVWRSQDGATTSSSAIDYTAKGRRFGAYWRLPLSSSVSVGAWSIEATVDGQPGGRFSFEVTDSDVARGVPVITRQPLGPSELYARLGQMFVRIERFSAEGRTLDAMSGVLGPQGRIYSSMAAVDDVDRIRGVLPGGDRRDLTNLLGWNRRQDWAVLEATGAMDTTLPIAAAESVKIADRAYSMEGNSSGGGVLVELNITGTRPGAPGGWLATFINGFGTPGAPVVNEYGELLGIVGATPGATRLAFVMRNREELKGVPIVPFSLLSMRENVPSTAVADLRSRGELIPVLVREQNVLSGGFAREIARTKIVIPSDQRDEFSAKELKVVAFVNWDPVERIKGVATFAMFDGDNRRVMESQPKKLSLGRGQSSLSSWELPIAGLSGVYRGDLMVDGKPMWRGFVRITP